MLNDDILGDKLRYTIAFWVVNDNNTAKVQFRETNETKRLTVDYTLDINLTQDYQSWMSPRTNFLTNFSHVVVAYNNDETETKLFSIHYAQAVVLGLGAVVGIMSLGLVLL